MSVQKKVFPLLLPLAVLVVHPAVVLGQTQQSEGIGPEELEYGIYADRVISASRVLLFEPLAEARIAEIGERIAEHSAKPNMEYTFRIANDATINAWATAGGFIYVTTGLLDILESEDELAAVLGHEVAHSANSHQINQLYNAHAKAQQGKFLGAVLGLGLAVVAGAAAPAGATQYDVSRAMDLGFQAGEAISMSLTNSMIKGYGRELELEADSVAVILADDAGYDPYALVTVFRRMARVRDRLGLTPENYASSLMHAEPGLEERISEAERRRSSAN